MILTKTVIKMAGAAIGEEAIEHVEWRSVTIKLSNRSFSYSFCVLQRHERGFHLSFAVRHW